MHIPLWGMGGRQRALVAPKGLHIRMVWFCRALPVLCQFLGLLGLCSPVWGVPLFREKVSEANKPSSVPWWLCDHHELLSFLHLIFLIYSMRMPWRPVWRLNEITYKTAVQSLAWGFAFFCFCFFFFFLPLLTYFLFPGLFSLPLHIQLTFSAPGGPPACSRLPAESSRCPSMNYLASQWGSCFLS